MIALNVSGLRPALACRSPALLERAPMTWLRERQLAVPSRLKQKAVRNLHLARIELATFSVLG